MGMRPSWIDADDRDEVRRAIEAELPESHRRALSIEAARLPRPERWPDVGWMRSWITRAAAFHMFERLQAAGLTKERARAQVSTHLRIPSKSVERWQIELRADTWLA